ncbi:MAG TPA: aspartate-semialdehyde dehydrogenase [candidate division WOR-3 bacterium]|uniref:Aspartate-semialdehyde dehydrogenase n=1 Tax=candidate division WOR-3 bacterium TaxID=2052148 RepID=A0A9C9K0H6_UNCW3|nr:aspartate-semialdehyde dehydrogenase [candidate division WOR-3 bacterium]
MKNVAVLGATGLVGETVIKILEERNFPVKELFPFASTRSEGQQIIFKDTEIGIYTEIDDFLNQVDIVFGCLDAPLSRELIPRFKDKAVVIDNSNAFRMEPDVPLVVPEVNPEKIKEHSGLIANPNCSTIQMVVALYPLHKKARIKRVFVATYQSVSGYGKGAVEELQYEIECLGMNEEIRKYEDSVFPLPIGNNVIPQIGGFNEEGYTTEEMKMVNETRKIFDDPTISVTSTCVRIPVFISHSEAISIEFEQPLSPNEAKEILREAPGVRLFEKEDKYPVPYHASGKDLVFVGRLRRDLAFENGLAMWVVADNVRKGAALNAVQIAELL